MTADYLVSHVGPFPVRAQRDVADSQQAELVRRVKDCVDLLANSMGDIDGR
jgi:hypothetical protein